MKFYSIAAAMTITASAAHAATKVSGEDHDAIVTGLRHLVNTDDIDRSLDKLGDFLQDLLEGVLEKKDALAPQSVTTTDATPVSTAASKSGKATGCSGKSGKSKGAPLFCDEALLSVSEISETSFVDSTDFDSVKGKYCNMHHNDNGRKLSFLPNSHGQRLLDSTGSKSAKSTGPANPITYKGTITSGTTTSSIACQQTPSIFLRSLPPDYWKVALTAGVEYSIIVRRVDCEFDPIAAIFSGDSCANDFSALTGENGSDDGLESPSECGPEAPFGDPSFTFVPSTDGIYSLAVAEASGACPSDGNYDYVITISQNNCPSDS